MNATTFVKGLRSEGWRVLGETLAVHRTELNFENKYARPYTLYDEVYLEAWDHKGKTTVGLAISKHDENGDPVDTYKEMDITEYANTKDVLNDLPV